MKAKVLAALVAAAPFLAHGTDGYFSHGYGMVSKGMGGAAAAVTDSAFGGASNPATAAFAGNQWEVGLDLFSPWRKAERTDAPPQAGLNGSADSGSNYFPIPEIAYNRMINPSTALGVVVYGNGGMNTDYPGGQVPPMSACALFNPGPAMQGQSYNLLCGSGRLGVDLSQLIVAPTGAFRFAPGQSFGISPLFAYQRFKAEGLQAFDNPGFSSSPGNVTNRGYDNSTGWGVRVGYYGQLTPQFSVGASYASKMRMSRFDKYSGLFAESGRFDIPSHWMVGVAFEPTPQWQVAFDWERIQYSDSHSVNNPSDLALMCMGGDPSACLGGSGGAGFGWQDVNVVKLGVQYRVDSRLTLRAGYNHSDNPIRPQDVTFNFLAPGVVRDHITAGGTWNLDNASAVTAAAMYAFSNSVQGPSLFNAFSPGLAMQEKIQMYEWSVGVQYARHF